ncbi:MAG TPA: IPT/TIG domain-containing protein, partial [Desulfuromonadaceae bacterium]
MTALKKNITAITALAAIMLSLLVLPTVASASVTYDLTTFAGVNSDGTSSVTDGHFTFTGTNSAGINTINVDNYGIALDLNSASGDGSHGTINITPAAGGTVFTISSLTVAVYRCSGTGCTPNDYQYTFAVKDGASNVLATYTVTDTNNDGQGTIDPGGFNDVFNVKTLTFAPAIVSAVHVDITGVSGHDGGYLGAETLVTGFVVANYPAAPSAPTVTNISPASGPTAGGTGVTITGTNFISGET